MTSKFDFKKEYKNLYSAKENNFSIIKVIKFKYLTFEGSGHPKNSEFQNAIETLYKKAYSIKMLPQKGIVPDGYIEYVMPPLECDYWLLNDPKKFGWKAMLAQPDFVNKSILNKTKLFLQGDEFKKIKLENFSDGKAVQILYVGTYDKIGTVSDKIETFLKENNLEKNGNWHEIYLSDPRKVTPEKLKTIVRMPIKHK